MRALLAIFLLGCGPLCPAPPERGHSEGHVYEKTHCDDVDGESCCTYESDDGCRAEICDRGCGDWHEKPEHHICEER